MKKFRTLLLLTLTTLLTLVACTEPYDDSEIVDRLDHLEEEVDLLQEDVEALKTLLNALSANLQILSVEACDEGYIITFTDHSSITIRHGKDGADGKDGTNGKDGKDGEDGKDGSNGADGKDGKDGESLFESVVYDEDYAYFTLYDGSIIIVPLAKDVGIPTNEIWYSAPEKVDPYKEDVFGAKMVGNEWTEGVGGGIISFDGDVTTVGEYAFYFRKTITALILPSTVTSIGDDAFYGCTSLTRLQLNQGISTIGNTAFYNCRSLERLTIPESVTSIGERALEDCDTLTELAIPEGVTTVGYAAFRNCNHLETVYCKPITPPAISTNTWGNWLGFSLNLETMKVYVPSQSVEAYKSAPGWSEYADYIVGYDY